MTLDSTHPDGTHPDAPLERFLDAPAWPHNPVRPLKALRHMRALIADKENTEEVFHILHALNGNAYERRFQAFVRSADGQARIAQARVLPPLLDNHARWKALPDGTFGRAYVDFMEREGLTAAGLVEESLKPAGSARMRAKVDPLRLWWGDRSRDTHDLYHVLTGLGRDALGEACVLSFTYPQHGGRGLKFIAWLAVMEARKALPKGAPAFRALRECERLGREAAFIDAQDLLALFALPLDEARARLGVGTPTFYHQCHAICREKGIDPYQLIAPA